MYNSVTKDNKQKRNFFFRKKREEQKTSDEDVNLLDDTVLHNTSPLKKPLVYQDKEKNETLYGYSQHNLDSLVNLIRFVIVLFSAICLVLFLMILYVFYIFEKYHVLTQIVQALA